MSAINKQQPVMPSDAPKATSDDAIPHPSVGLNAKRSCTDILCGWSFLIVGMILIIVTASTAFKLGDPKRLLYGQDYLGNICGEPKQNDVPPSAQADWSRRLYLWYPLTYDFKQKKLLVEEALKLGLCLDSCPPPLALVTPYQKAGVTEKPPPWLVLVNSTPDINFRRCIPQIFTFDCQGDLDCKAFVIASNETFSAAMQLGAFTNSALEEVRKYSWCIWVGLGVGLVLCFVWLCLIRFLLKPMIVITMVLLQLLFIGIGYMFWQLRTDELAKAAPNEETARWFLAGSIIGWIFAGGFLIIMFFYGKNLMLSVDVIEEASRVPVDIPTLIFVPPVTMLPVIGFAAFALVLAIFIQSTGENITLSLPMPNFLNESDARTRDIIANGSEGLAGITFNNSVTVKEVQFPSWRKFAHLYNLFFFLWMFGLQNALCYMVIALCTTFWYFSNPGDDKRPPLGAVARAWWITVRYHIGTLAFGSMLVAIVQIVRVMLLLLEKQMQDAKELGDATKCMFKMAQCCLACVEWCVKFINKSAYIVQAITGDSFFPAAKRGLEMVGENIMTVGMITVISEYVILFGKLMVTCSTVIISYLIMKGAGAQDGITGGVLILFIICVLVFFIVSLFANIFSVCIDTMLFCFCYDKAEPGHNYFPTDLNLYISTIAASKKGSVDKGPNKDAAAANAEPLKPMLVQPALKL